jgi:hypothetical protein
MSPDESSGDGYYVEYYRGKNSVAVMRNEGMDSGFVAFESKDRKTAFPRGLKIGGPISTALNAKIEGKYSKENNGGGVMHKWAIDGYVVGIFESGGKIATIGYVSPGYFKEITVNPDLIYTN